MNIRSSLVKTLAILLLTMATTACKSEQHPGPGDIAVSWEVISNTFKDEPGVKARFVIRNNSQFSLTGSGWELYYNQSPRVVLKTHPGSNANVEHINGDWFRIVPGENFLLEPGQEAAITYECRFWWIKETDAPQGLYFVFSSPNGRQTIVEPTGYTVLPFERPEQMTRHNRDNAPVPSPELSWFLNKDLTLLPEEELLPLIPLPYYYTPVKSKICPDRLPVIFHDEKLTFEASFLQKQLQQLTGAELSISSESPQTDEGIFLQLDESLTVAGKSAEVYTLEINDQGHVTITGSDAGGVFYGLQSLLSMVAGEPAGTENSPLCFPVIRIEDAPRFTWRGLHVDVARNFHSKESLMKVIDIMAFYKLNTLHLHLTDDEGWRLEIGALPELTSVGAQRRHTSYDAPALHPAYGSGPHAWTEGKYGSGYYSQEDYVEILRYATRRHITVIPEINMPGHARAAIKAMEARYQRLIEDGDAEAAEKFRLTDPEETSVYLSAQLYKDNVVNVARESVYHFVETVVDEIIDLYATAGAPLQIIHVGGDEVPAGAWSESPMIEEKMKELPHISNPANMHSYFTHRVLEILQARDLKMAGWEEVALKSDAAGTHVPNVQFAGGDVIPFVWNNLWGAQDLGYRLANRGFPVVLCHVTALYFDLAYNKDPREPGLYWAGFVNTYSAWHYSPLNVFSTTLKDNMGRMIDPETEYMGMERLLPGARENILGIQAQLWSETIIGSQRLEYYLLPKLAGLAQSAWSAERSWENMGNTRRRADLVRNQWNVFANTLGQRELQKLSRLSGGYHYRIPLPGATISDGLLKVNSEFPGLIIHYTLDGSEPGLSSPVFTQPVPVNDEVVKLKAFDQAGRESRMVELKPDQDMEDDIW